MKENIKGAIQISAVTAAVLVVALIFLIGFRKNEHISAVIVGYLISLINILFAFISISWAFGKSNGTFFKVVLGGMGIRFLILITAIFLIVKFTQIRIAGFIISLVSFYLLLQFLEIKFIQKNIRTRKATT